MCGIVGYIGPNSPVPIIIEGLRRLEYRGYDSAGIAIAGGPAGLELRRAPGKLRNLEAVLADKPLSGSFGIGHTRWATHGRPTEENAHPHRDGSGTLVVVHNGIVENYLALKQELIAKGHKFQSETDTEIIAHVIEDELNRAAESSPKSLGAPSFAASSRRVGSTESDIDPNESVLTLPNTPSLPLEEAVRRAVKRLTGAFAIGVLSANEPNKLVAARLGPPAVLGIGEGEYFLASDVPGILHHTRNIHFLADGEIAILTPEGITLTDFDAAPLPLKVQRIAWDPIQAEKAGYKHFMLKEIYEQPRAIRDTILGRISPDTGRVFLPDMSITEADLIAATQITIAACGTSWHSGLAGKFMIERLARLRTEVDYASEFRYRNPISDPASIGLLITQSGETADTLAAQRELIALGSKTLAICNVVGAAVSREAQGTITTNAGPEIGVASTKAFTAQLTALFLLALKLGQVRGAVSDAESLHLATELGKIPAKLELMLNINSNVSTGMSEGVAAPQPINSAAAINSSATTNSNAVVPSEAKNKNESVILSEATAGSPVEGPAVPSYPGPDRRKSPRLSLTDQCCELAKIYSTANDFLFLGRGIHYPIALEGALKLKEISYIHAEGYPAGEMKHGPNALIDETLPVVCIATQDPTDPTSVLKYEKTLSNIQEVTARSGRVIAIAIEGDQTIAQLVDHVIYIPQSPELLLPILEVVPLQLLAYHIAVRRGCDVDQPRNLAKSVTVE
ncbi:MAG TPA: glutamine--fructose-6-phosphate aminotransferase [Acidobacteriaceae bacterium]|nr:glutamine--fructose-6-phosphate aminotransferase [Acidobacteriaceae bacterium]